MSEAENSLLILHLSDLHFGENSRFRGLDPRDIGQRFSKAIGTNLAEKDIERKIDVVVVTGDISEKSLPSEYSDAQKFFETLSTELSLDRRRFVFCPGNHDVSWIECKRAELALEEQGGPKDRLQEFINLAKLQPYERFLQQFQGAKREDVGFVLPANACVYTFDDLNLSVAALNTCEQETHRDADHFGLIGSTQAQGLMNYWSQSENSSKIKIIALHHNPVPIVPDSVAKWLKYLENAAKDGRLNNDVLKRFASDLVGFHGRELLDRIAEDVGVSLILHGHHHADTVSTIPWKKGEKGFTHILAAGSWGIVPEQLPELQPNGTQLLYLNLKERELNAWRLIYEPRARSEGSVSLGQFVADKIQLKGYKQDLSVPATTTTTTTPLPVKNLLSEKDREFPFPPRIWRLPHSRQAITHTFEVAGHEGVITVGLYENGRPGEIFISMAKAGSTVAGLMDTIAILFSRLIQCGYPIPAVLKRLEGMRFEPSGFTKNPDLPIAKSIVDYIARWLMLTFVTNKGEKVEEWSEDGPLCSGCGCLQARVDGAFRCYNCGH